ncbi:hypothetical protein SSTU70S_00809 [Stutzerimonas stutzeri]
MQPLDSPTVPVFKLYGEQQIWPTPDLLHCELIPRRSSLYQWEIQPHRHADLFQLFYIQRGNSQVEIEGKRHDIERASLQVVPPLCVHGFQFPEDIEGYVLTLAAPLVARFEAELGPHLSGADCYPVGEDSRLYIDTLFAALLEEYEGSKPFRDTLLQSMVSTLLIWYLSAPATTGRYQWHGAQSRVSGRFHQARGAALPRAPVRGGLCSPCRGFQYLSE